LEHGPPERRVVYADQREGNDLRNAQHGEGPVERHH